MNQYFKDGNNRIVAVRINGENFSKSGLVRIKGSKKLSSEAARGVLVKTFMPTGPIDPFTGCRELRYI